MPAHPALLFGRLEIGRTGVIKEQEGRELGPEILVAEDGVNRESVAHPVAFAGAVDAAYVFHGPSSRSYDE
jgi:hypothetical protein